jgi:hypothetical protein
MNTGSTYQTRSIPPLSSIMDASADKSFVTPDVIGAKEFMVAGLTNELQCDAPSDWTRRRG